MVTKNTDMNQLLLDVAEAFDRGADWIFKNHGIDLPGGPRVVTNLHETRYNIIRDIATSLRDAAHNLNYRLVATVTDMNTGKIIFEGDVTEANAIMEKCCGPGQILRCDVR